MFANAEQLWKAGRDREAIPLLQEIVRLDPYAPQARHDLGIAYLRSGRLQLAAQSLQRAVQLRPSFELALRYLVDALEPLGRDEEMIEACRKISRIAREPGTARFYAAKSLAKEGKIAEAETELRRALVAAPEDLGALLELGRVLSDIGNFAEAERALTLATATVPNAFQSLTEIRQMTEADRPLVQRMEAALNRTDLEAASRAAVCFGLGKAYADLGDPAAAMRFYDEGNRLRALSVRFDRAGTTAEFDGVIHAFTAELLDRAAKGLAAPPRDDDELPVFVVGMPRSGTTLLEQILSSHPAVAAGGELPFWRRRLSEWRSRGPVTIKSDAMFAARNDYLRHLRKIGPGALRITDKAPRNFEHLWLIWLALPKARIIHIRRHPLDTCLSIYFSNFLATQDFAWTRGDLVFFYRQYERLMEHWRKTLSADRYIEVEYERLVTNREAETRRLVAFLGLDWDDACLAPERNARVVKTASVWQARQPVYRTSVERWRRYEPWLGELRELLPIEPASPSPIAERRDG